jgi:hypothetical protein
MEKLDSLLSARERPLLTGDCGSTPEVGVRTRYLWIKWIPHVAGVRRPLRSSFAATAESDPGGRAGVSVCRDNRTGNEVHVSAYNDLHAPIWYLDRELASKCAEIVN